MRIRWRYVLPTVGILLFALVSYHSLRVNRESKNATARYFWWGAIRLDSDPLNRRQELSTPCKEGSDCVGWDDIASIRVEPGLLIQTLMLSAFPAFLVGAIIVGSLRRLGISEVASFMVTMPLLIVAWYYFVGGLIDRWISKPRSQSDVASRQLL
jgi:hypothetical protein